MSFYKFSMILIFVIIVFGCASRPPALPPSDSAQLPWGALDLDVEKDYSEFTLKRSLGKIVEAKFKQYSGSSSKIPFNILTLSGGGSGGAYGAGNLYGWKEHGDIPAFDVVTGISTGSIMASFAFLGGEEIDRLKTIFNSLKTQDLYKSSWFSWFTRATINNPKPLKELLRRGIDEPFLARIAEEHRKGRRLYMGSTNLDTGQLVVWDMGAIAASDRPDKAQRYRDIIYASSAIPILLPPQLFEVDVNDETYSQLHVDGGLHSNVFMIGLLVNWAEVMQLTPEQNINFDVNLYVIANRKYRERHIYQPVPIESGGVIKSLLLVATDLLFDRSVFRLYENAKRRGFNFHMATIPNDTHLIKSAMIFNPEEMQALFDLAYQQSVAGYPWKTIVESIEYDNNNENTKSGP